MSDQRVLLIPGGPHTLLATKILNICDCLEQQQYYSLKDQYFKVDHRIAWNNNDGDTPEHANHPDFQGHLLLVPAFHP